MKLSDKGVSSHLRRKERPAIQKRYWKSRLWSTGVSYFEQFVWDLETRGVSNIDIPVLVLGITA